MGLSLCLTKSLLEITESQDSSGRVTYSFLPMTMSRWLLEGDPPVSLGNLCQCLAVLPIGEVLQALHHTREPTAGHSTTTTTTQKRISNKFLQPSVTHVHVG